MAGVPWCKYTVRSNRRIIPQDCHGSLAYVQYIRVDGWGPISVNIGNIATFPLYTYICIKSVAIEGLYLEDC